MPSFSFMSGNNKLSLEHKCDDDDDELWPCRALFHSLPSTNTHVTNAVWFSYEHSKLRPWKNHLTSLYNTAILLIYWSIVCLKTLLTRIWISSVEFYKTYFWAAKKKKTESQCMIDVPQNVLSRTSTTVCNIKKRPWAIRLPFVIARLRINAFTPSCTQ